MCADREERQRVAQTVFINEGVPQSEQERRKEYWLCLCWPLWPHSLFLVLIPVLTRLILVLKGVYFGPEKVSKCNITTSQNRIKGTLMRAGFVYQKDAGLFSSPGRCHGGGA